MLITVCLLISSTAFHQLTDDGNDRVRLHRYTTHVMESVPILFSLGMGADIYCIRGRHCREHRRGCTCNYCDRDRAIFLVWATLVGAN